MEKLTRKKKKEVNNKVNNSHSLQHMAKLCRAAYQCVATGSFSTYICIFIVFLM